MNPFDFFAQNIKMLDEGKPDVPVPQISAPEPALVPEELPRNELPPQEAAPPMDDIPLPKSNSDSGPKPAEEAKTKPQDKEEEDARMADINELVKKLEAEEQLLKKSGAKAEIATKKETAQKPAELAKKEEPKKPATPAKKATPMKISHEKVEIPVSELWVDKYAPRTTAEIVGNSEIVKSLTEWARDWHEVVIRGNKKRVDFQFRRGKESTQSNLNARACLLSGPPGVGKSTLARLVAKELGYEVLETSASDQRSKKVIESLLTDAVDNESIMFYTRSEGGRKPQEKRPSKKTLVIMDEVDGLSGSNDKGGVQALIKIIQNTAVPIVCICNDRQNTKVRSLANHCYDLKFLRYGFLVTRNGG